MDITKLSTKGQIVIPDAIRKNFEVGTAFNVIKQNDLIVLKPLSGLSKDEEKELIELEKIWKDIDSGKGIVMNESDFIKEMNAW